MRLSSTAALEGAIMKNTLFTLLAIWVIWTSDSAAALFDKNDFEERIQTLSEIGEAPQLALNRMISTFTNAIQARDISSRSREAETLLKQIETAKSVTAEALRQVEALSQIPVLTDNEQIDPILQEQEKRAIRNYTALLAILGDFETAAISLRDRDEEGAIQALQSFAKMSVMLLRDNAHQARLRSKLTPEFAWAEPMEAAYAEFLDGLATVLDCLPTVDRCRTELEALKGRAENIQTLTDTAETLLSGTHDNPGDELLAAAGPGITERIALLRVAAEELKMASSTSSRVQLRAHLVELRTINRQIIASQQAQMQLQ